MPSRESTEPEWTRSLTSRGYEFTVDGGPDSFYALGIEVEGSETAWLISDTVRSLEEMR